MNSLPYVGSPTASGAVPTQTEARAYFGRMATSPTPAFREAVNWAIWRWKAIGVWPHYKGLWILAADTSQAGLLSVIGDTPRDAVIVGTSPTFTARKGFSGFQSGRQVQFPITSTLLASDGVFGFAALKAVVQNDVTDPENPVPHYGPMIQCDAGAEYQRPGNFDYGSTDGAYGIRLSGMTRPLVTGLVVGGGKSAVAITAGGVGTIGGTSGLARGSNYITTGHGLTALNRLCAYGFIDAAASQAQCRQAMAILAAMLDMLGALD
ncbi:MAG: hypothetical protein U1C74_14780 [Phenylobacterium sp.]|nr:hypothetical protein [Phenylobacterium sp.]